MSEVKYKDTHPYQNMTPTQRKIFDDLEENGMRGSKRYARMSVGRWKAKRAKMTEEEIEEMERAMDKKSKIMSMAFLIIVGVALIEAIMACIEIAG